MKKEIVFASVFAALIGVSMSPLALAKEEMGMMGGDPDHAQCAIGGKKGMMGKEMMGGMMMKGMMGKSVTATSDGGVVVQSGNQLFKYDKKLSLVNKAEIPVDMEMMQKDMAGMMKMCPMMKGDGGMMGSTDGAEGITAGSGSAATASVDSTDHAAHH